MSSMIDLRSDTVTLPTPEMREAMAKAVVGDDVYGEDPSVNQLQELAANMLGKEAALFVPSGTMGNLASVLAHCERGDEVILGDKAHTFLFEAGGIAALGGVHPRPIANQADGTLNLDDIHSAIRSDDAHYPVSRLITLENTHNRCSGAVLPIDYTREVSELAHENGLRTHLDGARLFNAAVASGLPANDLAAPFDSVTFCLSKALCAPVGSVICGSKDFIYRAHRIRKQLGGGMRQAGVLAAAGIISLTKMVDRLADDHVRAKKLAEELQEISGIEIPEWPITNMVYIYLSESVELSPSLFQEKLKDRGVLFNHTGNRRFRLVTHYWIDDQGISDTVSAIADVLASAS